MSLTETYDVVAIGGAVIGSSVAYYLAADPDFSGKILVVEKDPSYQRCASALSAAGIRQQYSSAINIQISLYGIEFLRRIGETLRVAGDRPDIQLHEGGYLFLATEENRPILEENHALQTKLGADILFLEPLSLVERFPWLSVEGLSAGCLGTVGRRLVRWLRLDAGFSPQGARTGRCLSVSCSDRRRTDGRPCHGGTAGRRYAHVLRRRRQRRWCRRTRNRACSRPRHTGS
jgi:hypothetical protein